MSELYKRVSEPVYQGETKIGSVTVKIEVDTNYHTHDELGLELAERIRANAQNRIQGFQDGLDDGELE